jgi:hypothetical protein
MMCSHHIPEGISVHRAQLTLCPRNISVSYHSRLDREYSVIFIGRCVASIIWLQWSISSILWCHLEKALPLIPLVLIPLIWWPRVYGTYYNFTSKSSPFAKKNISYRRSVINYGESRDRLEAHVSLSNKKQCACFIRTWSD